MTPRTEDGYMSILVSWLQKTGFYLPSLRRLSSTERSRLLSQGADNTQCGVFMIAFVVCLCMGRSFDFNLFDTDEIRENLARAITGYSRVDGLVDGGFLWIGMFFFKQF